MKQFLISASAIALVATAAACNQSSEEPITASYETPAATTDQDTFADATVPAEVQPVDVVHEAYMLGTDEYRASKLIGAPVVNAVGDEVATVADLYFGNDTDAPMVVVRDGGVAGVGGTLHLLAFDKAKISAWTGEDHPDFQFSVTEDSLDALPEFEQDGMDDYRLASEMIGTNATLAFSDDIARINDLVVGADGKARFALVSDGIVGADQYLVDAEKVTVAEGDTDGGLIINIDADTFTDAKVLRDAE